MLLFNLNPKESAKKLFEKETELDELVHLNQCTDIRPIQNSGFFGVFALLVVF